MNEEIEELTNFINFKRQRVKSMEADLYSGIADHQVACHLSFEIELEKRRIKRHERRLKELKFELERIGDTVMEYIKKPIKVKVLQWTGTNLEEVKDFAGDALEYSICDTAYEVGKGKPHVILKIKSLEGDVRVSKNDYIIKGVQGELYPCKPDIFALTYEPAKEEKNEK